MWMSRVVEDRARRSLDSTNVITPMVAGVKSIGIDHVEHLGNSIAGIARRRLESSKIRRARCVRSVSDIARESMVAVARSAGAAPVIESTDSYRPDNIRVEWGGTTFDVEHDGESATS